MKKRALQIFIIYVSFCVTLCVAQARRGVIQVAIADLFGNIPQNTSVSEPSPLYTETGTCPRVHQALFNEIVTIVGETKTHYQIDITTAYFITADSKKPYARYWISKQHCALITPEMAPYIPEPITYKNADSLNHKDIITLTEPWRDPKNHVTYSVGTRFKEIAAKSTDDYWVIIIYDHAKKTPIYHQLPRLYGTTTIPRTPHKKRTAMIQLIRSWIKGARNKSIPYVWGGCSYTRPYKGKFIKKSDCLCSWYAYPHMHCTPHTGFDCAGVMLRAAQIVGIPLFCKNSYTMAHTLTPLSRYEDLQIGDILWIPGHVMLIANLECNTLIEARGYPHGYGKLQEIPLAEEFKNIDTYRTLYEHMTAHKPLIRLNKKGCVMATIPDYKIVRLW